MFVVGVHSDPGMALRWSQAGPKLSLRGLRLGLKMGLRWLPRDFMSLVFGSRNSWVRKMGILGPLGATPRTQNDPKIASRGSQDSSKWSKMAPREALFQCILISRYEKSSRDQGGIKERSRIY